MRTENEDYMGQDPASQMAYSKIVCQEVKVRNEGRRRFATVSSIPVPEVRRPDQHTSKIEWLGIYDFLTNPNTCRKIMGRYDSCGLSGGPRSGLDSSSVLQNITQVVSR